MIGSITVTNHTDKDIQVNVLDEKDHIDKVVIINKKDYFVFMVDKISSVSWEKIKQG